MTAMGSDNISKANAERSSDEARENGRRGGVASGVARRFRRELAQAANYVIQDAKTAKAIREMVGAKTPRNYHRSIVSLMGLVVKGNLEAIRYFNELLGVGVVSRMDVTSDGRGIGPNTVQIEVVDRTEAEAHDGLEEGEP